MVGGVVSCTVTVKLQLLLLPPISLLTQFTVVTPEAKVLPETGEQTSTGLVSQISVVVTTNVPTAPAGLVLSSTRFVEQDIVGGVVSTTEKMKEQALLLLLASVATQWTVVRPRGKVLPETGEQTSDGAVSQISEVEVAYVTTAPAGLVHSMRRWEEQIIVGAVVSRTVTVKLHPLLLALESDAEQLTVVVPGANKLPEAGVQMTMTFVSHASLAVVK